MKPVKISLSQENILSKFKQLEWVTICVFHAETVKLRYKHFPRCKPPKAQKLWYRDRKLIFKYLFELLTHLNHFYKGLFFPKKLKILGCTVGPATKHWR